MSHSRMHNLLSNQPDDAKKQEKIDRTSLKTPEPSHTKTTIDKVDTLNKSNPKNPLSVYCYPLPDEDGSATLLGKLEIIEDYAKPPRSVKSL